MRCGFLFSLISLTLFTVFAKADGNEGSVYLQVNPFQQDVPAVEEILDKKVPEVPEVPEVLRKVVPNDVEQKDEVVKPSAELVETELPSNVEKISVTEVDKQVDDVATQTTQKKETTNEEKQAEHALFQMMRAFAMYDALADDQLLPNRDFDDENASGSDEKDTKNATKDKADAASSEATGHDSISNEEESDEEKKKDSSSSASGEDGKDVIRLHIKQKDNKPILIVKHIVQQVSPNGIEERDSLVRPYQPILAIDPPQPPPPHSSEELLSHRGKDLKPASGELNHKPHSAESREKIFIPRGGRIMFGSSEEGDIGFRHHPPPPPTILNMNVPLKDVLVIVIAVVAAVFALKKIGDYFFSDRQKVRAKLSTASKHPAVVMSPVMVNPFPTNETLPKKDLP